MIIFFKYTVLHGAGARSDNLDILFYLFSVGKNCVDTKKLFFLERNQLKALDEMISKYGLVFHLLQEGFGDLFQSDLIMGCTFKYKGRDFAPGCNRTAIASYIYSVLPARPNGYLQNSQTAECTLFSISHLILTIIDQMLSHRIRINTFEKLKSRKICSLTKVIKLDINSKRYL